MKVLIISKFAYEDFPGGIEMCVQEILTGLNSRGIRCDLLCSSIDRTYSETDHVSYRVIKTSSYGYKFSTSITPALIFKLKEIAPEYDIIHFQHPDPIGALAILYANPKAKIVMHWHSDILKQKKLLTIYKYIQNRVMKKSDAIIASSPNYADFSPWLKPFRDKVQVLPIGISEMAEKPDEKLVSDIRAEYAGKKLIFALGRLIYYKGFIYLAEAAKQLPDDYHIVIAGEGYERINIERVITENNLTNITLTGRITDEEKEAYLTVCDLFCLPAIERTEAFGIVQIEAMRKGKPVISTDIEGSGVAWVNTHNESGLTVPVKDEKSLAEAIIKVCEDDEYYSQLSKGAYSRFQKVFTRTAMTGKLVEIYSKLLG